MYNYFRDSSLTMSDTPSFTMPNSYHQKAFHDAKKRTTNAHGWLRDQDRAPWSPTYMAATVTAHINKSYPGVYNLDNCSTDGVPMHCVDGSEPTAKQLKNLMKTKEHASAPQLFGAPVKSWKTSPIGGFGRKGHHKRIHKKKEKTAFMKVITSERKGHHMALHMKT